MNRDRESERDAHTQTHQPNGHIRTYRLPRFQSTGRWLKQVEVAPRGDAAEEKPSGIVQGTPLAADKGPHTTAVQGIHSPCRQAVAVPYWGRGEGRGRGGEEGVVRGESCYGEELETPTVFICT